LLIKSDSDQTVNLSTYVQFLEPKKDKNDQKLSNKSNNKNKLINKYVYRDLVLFILSYSLTKNYYYYDQIKKRKLTDKTKFSNYGFIFN